MKLVKYLVRYSLPIVLILPSSSLKIEAVEQPHFATNYLLLVENPKNAVHLNVSALELFRKAYENRYTWNDEFPGYTAAVEFKQGRDRYNGYVRVNPDLSVEVTGIANEKASQTVKNGILLIAIHRRSTPFEVAHKNKAFKFGTVENSKVTEIIEDGGKATARYQVANNQIVQVNRLLGPHAVVVKTLDTEETPEGYIATRYQSSFYDTKTNQIIGSEISSDSYRKIGNYYLPIRRVIQHIENGNNFEVEFNFTKLEVISNKAN